MDDHDAAKPPKEGPFRRAYAWLILLGPWACAVVGLVVLGFGLFVNSPSQVRITELILGAAMVFAGTLMPRMTGSLELGATGFKGQVDSIPMALVLAHRAAENAIPEGEPDREERAKEAAARTVLDSSIWHELSHLQLQGASFRETPMRPLYLDLNVLQDLLSRDLRTRPSPAHEPPDEPPPAAKPS